MQQITITIGRGQEGAERLLSAERWQEFKDDVLDLVEWAGYDIVVNSDGTGSWTDDDGVTYSEQNHVWVALVPETMEIAQEAWRNLLASLARKYDQDAIAFGHGDSELIGRPLPDGGRITGTQTSVAPHEEAQ